MGVKGGAVARDIDPRQTHALPARRDRRQGGEQPLVLEVHQFVRRAVAG